MTPTLAGRWQTRLLLLSIVGALITLIFGYFFSNFATPFALLGYVLLLGFLWDILYNGLQTLRWDRDWPPLFFVAGGIAEGLFLWGLIQLIPLPGVDPDLSLGKFTAHYCTVFIFTLSIMLGPLKIVFLKWRFRGGQLW